MERKSHMKIRIKRVLPEKASLTGHVHLDREAELIIRRISAQTGLPMRSVLSQIILQAIEEVEVVD